jgi:RNA polymerase sigma-70 factor (ECF subfamily)
MDDEEFLRETLGAMDLVHNIARSMVPRPEDAEDLVQETYLSAYRAWIDQRRPRKVEPWLATICLNLGRSGFRHRARRPMEVPLVDADIAAADDAQREAIAALEQAAVRRALWTLPDEQRIAIALVDLAGLTARQAGEVMGTPRGTVLSRLHRGRKALATVLSPEIGERSEG